MIARQWSAPDRKKETAEDAKLREAVLSEVLDVKPSESWSDIAGLAGAKQVQHDGACLLLYVLCGREHSGSPSHQHYLCPTLLKSIPFCQGMLLWHDKCPNALR